MQCLMKYYYSMYSLLQELMASMLVLIWAKKIQVYLDSLFGVIL